MDTSDSEATVERPLYQQLASRTSEQIAKLMDEPSEDSEVHDPVLFTELLLRDAATERASDIHLEPYSGGIRVRFRIDGVLLDAMSLPTDTGGTLLRHLKALGGLDPLPAARPASAGRTIQIGGTTVDARTSVAPCVYGEKLAIRLLDVPQQVQQIGRLGMDSVSEEKVRGWLERVTGTFVVCGPTGSGKTTTLYSSLVQINKSETKIITTEDPVEYQLPGINQIQVHPKIGLTFSHSLRSILRHDPDVVLVGEIRDLETA